MLTRVQQRALGLLLLVVSGCGGGGSTGPTVTVTGETILYSFGSSSTDAMGPGGVLIQGSDGNFYGTTVHGGIGGGGSDAGVTGNGTVFKITPTGEETLLHRFAGAPTDGAYPYVLIQGSDGNFYGTTSNGGGNNVGTVFKLTPEGVETILYSFVAGNGPEFPEGGLVQGSDGNFYGTTYSGGGYGDGTIFKLTPDGVETLLFSFGATASDGASPLGHLVQGSDGNFYGVTLFGGDGNCPNGQVTISCGTVFKVTPEGVETVLHSFSGPDGEVPQSGLIQGSDGNFYGVTPGGSATFGTVFEITSDGLETTLYSFAPSSSQSIGAFPEAGLTEGSDGNFYGTTSVGGEKGGGTVFQLTPAGGLTTLYSFPSSPNPTPNDPPIPSYPDTSLVQGSDGNLYGATENLGANDRGYFFKLVISSH